MSYEVIITGLPEAITSISPARFVPGLRQGFDEVGHTVAREAAVIMATHTFTGKSEAAILAGVVTSGDAIGNIASHVRSGRKAVIAADHGWHSPSGKQPPVKTSFKHWLAARGIPESAGFAIARKIARSGLSFGQLNEYERGWQTVAPEAPAIIDAWLQRSLEGAP